MSMSSAWATFGVARAIFLNRSVSGKMARSDPSTLSLVQEIGRANAALIIVSLDTPSMESLKRFELASAPLKVIVPIAPVRGLRRGQKPKHHNAAIVAPRKIVAVTRIRR